MAKAKTIKEKPVRQESVPVPEYIKPMNSLQKEVRVGDTVNLSLRSLDVANGKYEFDKVNGLVREVGTKSLGLIGHTYMIPWWLIHNWEIYNAQD